MQRYISFFALLALIFTFTPTAATAQRTAAERQAELQARQDARQVEYTARQIERDKAIDENFRERYYTQIIPHVDSLSIDIYAIFLSVASRVINVETRMNEYIERVLKANNIPMRPAPGQPLPRGVVDFDIEEKFRNAQNCLDGNHFTTGSRSGPQSNGPCWQYIIPASGIAASSTVGLERVGPPTILPSFTAWPDYKTAMSLVPGALTVGIGNWAAPISLLPDLPPPVLPTGAQLTRDENGNLIPVLAYGSEAPRIVTGYGSQCLVGVPARYFPEQYIADPQYNPLPGTYIEQIAQIQELPLDVTFDTFCPTETKILNLAANWATNLFNKIFGTSITIQTMPFPTYEVLPQTLSLLPPPFSPYPQIDYCPPLGCTFVETEPFRTAVRIETQLFKSYVGDVRKSVDLIRDSYRALAHDIYEAVEYYEKTR